MSSRGPARVAAVFFLLSAALMLRAAPSVGSPARAMDPLDVPAAATRLAARTQTTAVAAAGSRIVAVGVRGLILYSDDAGAHWVQASVPVSCDLTTVFFVDDQRGWAGGHDGVILHSEDGGRTWVKQFDGNQAAALFKAHFGPKARAGDAEAARLLDEMQRNYAGGAEQPVLDIWFESARRGWAVGGFGTVFATEDGGKTWQSWVENVEIGEMLHYNAIRGFGGDVYIASERGIVFKLDRSRGRFVPLETGYKGSYFGLAGSPEFVIAFGLRGSAYRSRDRGATWTRLQVGVAGSLTAGAVLDDGSVVLVSQDGRLLRSTDQGDHFVPLVGARPTLFTGVVPSKQGPLILSGLSGVQAVTASR